ncbi:MAG: hypothetical protein IT196_05970 [Acidimicrobiales bacterium]|nr:hypothetical protein [Acidimicrobiales bacterium]
MTETFSSNRLDCPEALGLVAACGYGRVVGTWHALPHAWPVAFRVVDDVIMFPRPEGLEVSSRVGPAVVGLEVDNGSAGCRPEWSVMVVGELRRCAAPLPVELAGSPVDFDGSLDNVVALHPGVVIGRRLGAAGQPEQPPRQ